MKKLIQQLGEAIHESVSESEQIAGVVQDIRRHGFDVLLMLEATIGLNEVEQQPATLPGASKPDVIGQLGTPADASGFTSQDVNFLRSLRISMQDDEEPSQEQDAQDGDIQGLEDGA